MRLLDGCFCSKRGDSMCSEEESWSDEEDIVYSSEVFKSVGLERDDTGEVLSSGGGDLVSNSRLVINLFTENNA